MTPDRPTEPDSETLLECPCCGSIGAVADKDGLFHEEDPLVCGCDGHVCVEEDGDIWINAYDCEVAHD